MQIESNRAHLLFIEISISVLPGNFLPLTLSIADFNVCKLGGLNPSPSGEDFSII